MALWSTDAGGEPHKVSAAGIKDSKTQRRIKRWIASDASLIGWPLFLIGRAISLPGVKRRLDLLALDASTGSTVIIDLTWGIADPKRLTEAIQYASQVATWDHQQLEDSARAFYKGGNDFNLTFAFENYCSQNGIDEVPEINATQRIYMIGLEVSADLIASALWLQENHVDIKLAELEYFLDSTVGDNIGMILLNSRILPRPQKKDVPITKPESSEPMLWTLDGKSWHLNRRLDAPMREVLLALEEILSNSFNTKAPDYEHRLYIDYWVGGAVWIRLHTFPDFLVLCFLVQKNKIDVHAIATKLGIDYLDIDMNQRQRDALGSSISNLYGKERERIQIRIKNGFNIEAPEFIHFLEMTLKLRAPGNFNVS